MKRLILLGLLAAPAIGCTTFKPVGPLTTNSPPKRSTDPLAAVLGPKDIGAMPVIPDGPPPPAPIRSVTPGDVTPQTANDAAKKLMQEIEADRKAGEAMPYRAEISRVPTNGR